MAFPLEHQGVEEILGEGQVVLNACAHQDLHRGLCLHLLVAGKKKVQDDQDPGPRVPELVPEFPGGVHGVGVHRHAPRQKGAVEGDDELGGVREHDGHPVPGFQAGLLKAFGEGLHLLPQVSVAKTSPQEFQGLLVGIAAGVFP